MSHPAGLNGQQIQHQIGQVASDVDRLCQNMARVIQGKPEVIRYSVICLLAEGHLLLEDVPGTGKTSLARALASSLGITWHRIQFTPDLLPSDVTGVSIYNQNSHEFEFKKGPIFANIVLADEINRASPKTQSALLEVMEEGTLSADSDTFEMARPFMVVATQNPIDMEGTYVLPEAQVDRFLMRLSVGYPDAESEAAVLRTQKMGATVTHLSPVLSAQAITSMIGIVKQVEVSARDRVLHRRHRRGHAEHGRTAPGRLAPRQPGPAASRPRRGGSGRSLVRHPRGRQGDGPDRAGPPPDPAARGRTAGPHRGRTDHPGPGRRPGPARARPLTTRH